MIAPNPTPTAQALAEELRCDRDHAALRALKASPEFSHATTRDLMPSSILLYVHHPTSPTGVHLHHDLIGNRNCDECLSIFRPHRGPTRGAIAEGWAR